MIKHHLEVTGVIVRRIGLTFPVATMLSFDPAVDRVFDVKQGTGMGATPHRTEWNSQGVGHGMG